VTQLGREPRLAASSRARALSRLAIIQLVANLIGPPLGGWFTDGPGWRLGVLTGVPLSLGALLRGRRRRADCADVAV